MIQTLIRDKRGFTEKGSWYKGNLHSHTTNSDGRLGPEEAVKLYRSQGYHFLCFSEHDLYTDNRAQFNCEDFIILPGLEASAVLCEEGTGRRKKVHHIHGILGTERMRESAGDRCFAGREYVKPRTYMGTWDGAAVAQELNDYLRGRGCITVYNHPVWSRVEAEEYIGTDGLWALEIFNYNTVNESGTGADTTDWDRMLRQGKRLMAVATDDNHNEGLFADSCGGYIVVKAPCLTHEEIIKNMISGNYYASAGPEIHDWGIKDGTAYVDCSPVYRIDFIAGNHVGDGTSFVWRTRDDRYTHGEYQLCGDESYVRVQCTDRFGRTAWSNPIYVE